MSKLYKIARNRGTKFTVNCPITKKSYKFFGSKQGRTDIKEIPEETYLWLLSDTTAFSDGELALVDMEDKKELKEQSFDEDIEVIENNTHTRDEIIKILNGNTNSMKKKLESITIKEEKAFVMQVAKEVKLDSNAKLTFLETWSKK